MKLKQFSRIVAIGSLGSTVGFLASCKDSKTESADQNNTPAKETPAKPATPAKPNTPSAPVAEGKVPIYLVTVSGSGWGIGRKTSSVLTAQSGVKKVKLSGLRATVFVEEGTDLDKEEITKQLTAKGLSLVSMETGEIGAPVAAYTIKVKGTGWSDTADKVRVALEKMDVVSTAFVNKTIELYLNEDVALDEEAIKTAITGAGAKFVAMQKADSVSL